MPLSAGEIFAGYRIVRLLGSGGMGEVYLAEHPRLPRRDALKVLRSDASADPDYRARFNREADLASKLRHPHIVSVHDRGEHDGQLWISMDYIDGTDAARIMRDRYPAGMPPEEAVEIITAVAGALDYANQQGLLHRDVKPANILLSQPDPDGQRQVFLADFGIARELADPGGITATNITVGTVAYAAPEQLMGQELDARADQYALAATAFHLLTGAPPYQHSNPVAIIGQHLNAAIPKLGDHRPDLAALDDAMSTALAKNPDQRFSSCRDFAKALSERVTGALIEDRQTEADITVPSPVPAPSKARRKASWTRATTAMAALVGFMLVGALIFLGILFSRGRHAPTPHLPNASMAPTPALPVTASATTPPSAPSTNSSTTTTTAAPSIPAAQSGIAMGLPCSGSEYGKLAHDPNTGQEIFCHSDPISYGKWEATPSDVKGIYIIGTSCLGEQTGERVPLARSTDGYLITCEPASWAGPIGGSAMIWQRYRAIFDPGA